jgi:signal peptidase I
MIKLFKYYGNVTNAGLVARNYFGGIELTKLKSILIISLLFILLNSCLNSKTFKLIGHNMEPIYKMGDIIIINENNKIEFNNNDIIAYYMPEKWQGNGALNDKKAVVIVRIIGSRNDIVEIKDNKLVLNDKEIDNSFLDFDDFKNNQMFINKLVNNPYKLKDNEYFIMGENRNNSKDSRFFGPITKDMIIGKVSGKVYK